MSALLRIGLGLGLALLLAAPGAPARAGGADPGSTEVFGAWSFYNNLGWNEFRSGNLDLARMRFTQAVEYLRPIQKKYPRLMSRSCHDLTRVLCAQGKFSDAEAMAKWVVEAREHDPRTRDDVMFDSVYLLSVVYRELDHDPAEVVPLLRRAVALEESNLGAADVRLGLTIKELADAEAASGALREADGHYRRAALIYKQGRAINFNLVEALDARADVLAKLGQATHANLLREEADEVRDGARMRIADPLLNPLATLAVTRDAP